MNFVDGLLLSRMLLSGFILKPVHFSGKCACFSLLLLLSLKLSSKDNFALMEHIKPRHGCVGLWLTGRPSECDLGEMAMVPANCYIRKKEFG